MVSKKCTQTNPQMLVGKMVICVESVTKSATKQRKVDLQLSPKKTGKIRGILTGKLNLHGCKA